MMRLTAAGYTDKEIAAELGLTHNTVETYWTRIREKFGAQSKASAAISYFTARVESMQEELLEEQSALKMALDASGQHVSHLVEGSQRLLRSAKKTTQLLSLFQRATTCSRSFAYEVKASNPFECLFISETASEFGIDVRAIRLDEISFWDCVFLDDVSRVHELTFSTAFSPDVRLLYMYRLGRENPSWVIDSHQCIYDHDNRLRSFAGFVLDIQPFVDANSIVPQVQRLEIPSLRIPSTSEDPPATGINPAIF